jgi:anti-sigma regulatory factor (Ser/Thr protein kinase)
MEQLPELLDHAAESARRAGFADAAAFKAQVVLEELFVNIFMHAYQGEEGRVDITLEVTDEEFFLRTEDWGPPFDPLSAELSDPLSRFEQGPGGAGLVLVRSMSENPRYYREDGRNIYETRVKVSPQ